MFVRMGWTITFGIYLIGLAVLGGCGGGGEQSRPREESRLKSLGVLYGMFTGQNRGQPPKDEAEFKAFIAQNGSNVTSKFTSPDDLFVSERDGQPYVIFYGNLNPANKLNGQPVMGYEKVGANGTRFVGNYLGQVEEVTEDQFKQMVPSP